MEKEYECGTCKGTYPSYEVLVNSGEYGQKDVVICINCLESRVKAFLQRTMKNELKWMYHYDIDDEAFGVETDKYRWCKLVVDGKASIEDLLEYFTKYYPNDEKYFIIKIKELM